MRHVPITLAWVLSAVVAVAAPPTLVVTPANPRPGDAVSVTGKISLTFSVRGAGSKIVSESKKSVAFFMPENGAGVIVVASGTMPVNDLNDVATVVLGGGSPVPPPPDPVDPLVAVLQATADQEPGEKVFLTALSKLYEFASSDLSGATDTWGDWTARMKKEATNLFVSGRLSKTQKAVQDYLYGKVDYKDKSLTVPTAEQRATAAAEFRVVAAALAKVK